MKKTKKQQVLEKHKNLIREYKQYEVKWKLTRGSAFKKLQGDEMTEGSSFIAAKSAEHCKQTFANYNIAGRKYKVISVTEVSDVPV